MMMTLEKLIEAKNITKYRLSKESGIPYTTLGDICRGKTDLRKCSAETVYKLAKILGITMEELLADLVVNRPDFELFKSSVCHRVKALGDVDFIIDTLESRDIREYFERKWYPESLYLLAMLDYISRVNNVPLCSEYDDLRRCRLKETIYPAGILAICAAEKSDASKRRAVKEAIPEFMRFNIVENEVRNVI